MSFNIRIPFVVATHAKKFATITNLKDKSLAGAFGFTKSSTVAQMYAHNGTSATPVAGYMGPTLSVHALGTSDALQITPQMSGSLILLDAASGSTVTLPAPQTGLWFQFVVTVSVTSNNHKIVTKTTGTDLFIGSLWETVAAGTGTSFFPNGSSHSACTMNGTTTGGLINTAIDVYCTGSAQWLIDGTNFASGTIATPFANS